MKNQLLCISIAALFSVNAYAGGPTTPTSTSNANVTATGGAGGTGGSASGGSATGGAASGNSSTMDVTVNIPSTATQGTSASAAPSGTNATSAIPASGTYTTHETVETTGTSTVKVAPPVAAPALTTTMSDTCMGSASFGLSFSGFGAGGGSTVVDEACVRRLDAREFRAMGMPEVALALLCQSPANKKAVEATGRDCPGSPRTTAAPVSLATPEIHQNIVSQVNPVPAVQVVAVNPPVAAKAEPQVPQLIQQDVQPNATPDPNSVLQPALNLEMISQESEKK